MGAFCNTFDLHEAIIGLKACFLSSLSDRFYCSLAIIIPLYTGKSVTPNASLANSEDQDKVLHNMAFHQSLHCLLRESGLQRKKYMYNFILKK